MVKRILASVLLTLSLTLSGGVGSHTADIPTKIVDWAEKNAWSVGTRSGTGSGFWINDTMFITACHVVDNTEFAKNGEAMVFAINKRDTDFVQLHLEICDTVRDVAVLTRIKGVEDDFNTKPTLIVDIPRLGTAVWGAGYPLNMPLVITQGHVASLSDPDYKSGGFIVTAPTMPGDSGSALLAIQDGEVVVVGMRSAVRSFERGGMSMGFRGMRTLVPHLTLVAPGQNIRDVIRDGIVIDRMAETP